MTLIPVLFFGGLDLALRLFGYGYSTAFFKKATIAGKAVYVENDQFGYRFFPKALARVPPPTVFPAKKPGKSYRIFILGESAALGDPEPAFGFGRYLEVLLQDRFPETEFKVVTAAMTAINSHALLPIARDCAKHEGDLWIIYMGNNEVVGPFGAGTVFGPKSPPLFFIRTSLALKATRIGQLMDSIIGRLGSTHAFSNSWEGMKMFLDATTRPSDSSRLRTDREFQRNLEDILATASKSGVPVLLCTIASNLKDCAPFASLHSPQLQDDQLHRWETTYNAGIESEAAGNYQEAIDRFESASEIDSDYAELQYRLGRCYLALKETDKAKHCFELARNQDALPFRTTSRLNEIIQASGRKFASQGVTVLDAETALMKASSDKITGSELFYEHVHLNFEGNQLLARLVAEQVMTLLPGLPAATNSQDWAAPETCHQRLAVTAWDRKRVYENIRQRETKPPFTLQLDHSRQMDLLTRELTNIRSQLNSNNISISKDLYLSALDRRPDDFLLHGNFARFLEETRDWTGAVREWERVHELLPQHFGPEYYLGNLLARLGRLDEAEQRLVNSLRIRPDTVEVMDELGGVLTREKEPAKAMSMFKNALALQPDNPQLHLHFAEALALQGQHDQAMTSLRSAVQLRPDYWEARYFLAVELAAHGRYAEARDQFGEVVRLKPDHVSAHFNYGVALAKMNQLPEAVRQFKETLRLDPSNQMASEYLSKLKIDVPH